MKVQIGERMLASWNGVNAPKPQLTLIKKSLLIPRMPKRSQHRRSTKEWKSSKNEKLVTSASTAKQSSATLREQKVKKGIVTPVTFPVTSTSPSWIQQRKQSCFVDPQVLEKRNMHWRTSKTLSSSDMEINSRPLIQTTMESFLTTSPSSTGLQTPLSTSSIMTATPASTLDTEQHLFQPTLPGFLHTTPKILSSWIPYLKNNKTPSIDVFQDTISYPNYSIIEWNEDRFQSWRQAQALWSLEQDDLRRIGFKPKPPQEFQYWEQPKK